MKGRNNRSNFSGHNILPSARILEEYEAAAPGSVNKLLEMAKKEQEHRHSWQDRYLKSHNFIYRCGQAFGFIYNIALLYLIIKLIKNNNSAFALKLFIINALLIALAIIVTFTERKMTTRKPPRRNGKVERSGQQQQRRESGDAQPQRHSHRNRRGPNR